MCLHPIVLISMAVTRVVALVVDENVQEAFFKLVLHYGHF